VPLWVKQEIDGWLDVAGIEKGPIFRRVLANGRVYRVLLPFPRKSRNTQRPSRITRCWRNEEELQLATQILGTDTAGCFAISRLLGLFFGDQSAVAVRIGTRLSSGKFALRSRSGSARWTRDCKCLCEAEFLLHVDIIPQQIAAGMVNSEQVWQFILCGFAVVLGDDGVPIAVRVFIRQKLYNEGHGHTEYPLRSFDLCRRN
jgi:hypothetical protein